MASRAPSWIRPHPAPVAPVSRGAPPRSATIGAPSPSGLPGSYVAQSNYARSGQSDQITSMNLPTAHNLPWAGVPPPITPNTSDPLGMSSRQFNAALPPPKLPGPTLGQVQGLGGSSWQAPRSLNTSQAPSTTTRNPRSWVPDPVTPAAGVPPKAPGLTPPSLGLGLTPPSLGFDFTSSNTDFLSKTAPSFPTPNLGFDWLSSSIAGFKTPGLDEPREASAAAPEPTTTASTTASTTAAPAASMGMPMPMDAPAAAPPAGARPAPPAPRPAREGCHLRFNTGASSRQHPAKQAQGIPNADATEESPVLLGICDGVSGCTKLGISPDVLPKEILGACRSKSKQWAATASQMKVDDGHWLMDLMKDAYDSTTSLGATTMLLASIHDSGSLLTANIGDCSLVVLRVIPAAGQAPAHLQVIFKTTPTRYDATKPVQVQRLPHMPVDRTHTVIQGAKLEAVVVQSGDYIVMGSDGLFDNLQDEDIQRVVERHCPKDRAAPTAVLNDAAAALVNTAIARAQPKKRGEAADTETPNTTMNPDDTTALVAAVVEVPNRDEYERWYWRSRGIQNPYSPQAAPVDSKLGPRTGSNHSVQRPSSQPPRGPAGSAKVPPTDMARARNPSCERAGYPEQPLQDCTNTNAGNLNSGDCPQRPPAPTEGTRGQSFKGKGSGKGTKGQGKGGPGAAGATSAEQQGKGAAAPDWWTKMAVPGKTATAPQPGAPGQLAAQAAQTQQTAAGQADDLPGDNPRLTSTILRAHEVKMATAESIARYSTGGNMNRGLTQRPPAIPEQRRMSGGGPQRNANENCVIS